MGRVRIRRVRVPARVSSARRRAVRAGDRTRPSRRAGRVRLGGRRPSHVRHGPGVPRSWLWTLGRAPMSATTASGCRLAGRSGQVRAPPGDATASAPHRVIQDPGGRCPHTPGALGTSCIRDAAAYDAGCVRRAQSRLPQRRRRRRRSARLAASARPQVAGGAPVLRAVNTTSAGTARGRLRHPAVAHPRLADGPCTRDAGVYDVATLGHRFVLLGEAGQAMRASRPSGDDPPSRGVDPGTTHPSRPDLHDGHRRRSDEDRRSTGP